MTAFTIYTIGSYKLISNIIENYYDKQLQDNGLPALAPAGVIDYSEPFWEADFPDNMDNVTAVDVGGYTGEYGTEPSMNDQWHQQVGGPLIKNLLEDIKVIAETNYISASSVFRAATETLIDSCNDKGREGSKGIILHILST